MEYTMASERKRSSLEEMLQEYLNPRPKMVEAAEDVISGGAAVMPFHEDLQAESASKGKLVKKTVKEALPLRASDFSMGVRYHGDRVSRKELEDEGWELEESSGEEENGQQEEDAFPRRTLDSSELEDKREPFQDDEEDGNEGEEVGEEEDSNDEEEESEEEIEIGEGDEILIRDKRPQKRKRSTASDEQESDDEENYRQEKKEDDENHGDMHSLMDDAEQEDEKLEQELRKLKEEETAAVSSMKSDNRKEMERAIHTKNQKLLWNSFMETRISLQQILSIANRFPHPHTRALFTTSLSALGEKGKRNKKQKTEIEDRMDEQEEHPETDSTQDHETCEKLKCGFEEASTSLLSLFSDLFSAKKALLAENESLAPVLKSSNTNGDTTLENGEDEEGLTTTKRVGPELWEEFQSIEEEMWKKTDEVIDRWNRKTTLSQGIMQKELKAINRTVLNQISQLLSDRQRLVKRTQMKRSSAKTFGAALYKKPEVPVADGVPQKGEKKKEEEHDEEIFDDSDFYHQLLREVVETGTANVTDPIALGRSHAQLRQLLRKNKKSVDQKASKGRKIRYDAMEPLVNFMPIIPTLQQGSPMADELFAHLFSS